MGLWFVVPGQDFLRFAQAKLISLVRKPKRLVLAFSFYSNLWAFSLFWGHPLLKWAPHSTRGPAGHVVAFYFPNVWLCLHTVPSSSRWCRPTSCSWRLHTKELDGQDFLRKGSLSPFGWLSASSRIEGGQAHKGSGSDRKPKFKRELAGLPSFHSG